MCGARTTAIPIPQSLSGRRIRRRKVNSGNDVFRYNVAALKGYAVVVQDTRGRFASDGVWTGLMWEQEIPDGYDTVQWTASQPWCDGNVGMWGVSYLAGAAWLTAMERPPNLRAIVVGMIADAPTESVETGGAISLDLLITWFVYQMMTDVVPKQIAAGTAPVDLIERLREVARDPRVVFEHLPLIEAPHLDVPGSPVTLSDVMDRKADMPPEFRYEQVEVPVLIYGGVVRSVVLRGAGAVSGVVQQRRQRGRGHDVHASVDPRSMGSRRPSAPDSGRTQPGS